MAELVDAPDAGQQARRAEDNDRENEATCPARVCQRKLRCPVGCKRCRPVPRFPGAGPSQVLATFRRWFVEHVSNVGNVLDRSGDNAAVDQFHRRIEGAKACDALRAVRHVNLDDSLANAVTEFSPDKQAASADLHQAHRFDIRSYRHERLRLDHQNVWSRSASGRAHLGRHAPPHRATTAPPRAVTVLPKKCNRPRRS